MEKKYRILAEFIKDIAGQTPDVESFIFTKDNISEYKLHIDINTLPIKNKMAEVDIALKFENTKDIKNKSFFKMIYATVVKIEDGIDTKDQLEPIFLKEVPTEVYPKIEKTFLDLLKHSGYPNVNFETKVDFYKLYENKNN